MWFFAGEHFQSVGSARHFGYIKGFFCTCRHTFIQSKHIFNRDYVCDFLFFPLVKDHHSSKFRSWLKGCSKGHRSGSATHFAEAEL